MRKKERGQALVETALVIGVVVLLVIGGIQLLQAFYTIRNVRAAAEDAVDLAAVYGGDTEEFRGQLPAILETYRLDPTLATVEVEPLQAGYLEVLTVTIMYPQVIRVYGLFELVIPPQEARALSQRDLEEGW